MFRAGIERLAADDETETLVLVSKPPDAEVVASLADVVPDDKRVIAAFVGPPVDAPFETHSTLESAALAAAQERGRTPFLQSPGVQERGPSPNLHERSGGVVLGLYSGGTLAHEAKAILEDVLGPGGGDRVVDLGADEYTRGRPHPMVDPGPRVERLEEAAEDDSVGCVLIDVVLGYAGHADPAGALAPAVERAAARTPVVARVCGTPGDPQDSEAQTNTLREAGAIVAPSNAAAARLAARAVA